MTTASEDALAAPTAARAQWLAPVAGLSFVALWSTGYTAGKIAVAHGGAFTTLVVRFGFAALIFALLAWLGGARWPERRQALHSGVTGFLQLALHFGGVYGALKLGASAGFAALVIGSMPLMVSLFAVLLGERLSRLQLLGLAIGFGGVLLVVAERLFGAQTNLYAIIVLIVGLIGISVGTLYQKRHGSAIDLRMGLFIQNLTATVVLLPFSLAVEHFDHDNSLAFWASSTWLVLVNTVGNFALLFVLIRNGAATKVATLFYLIPAAGAFVGHFVLDERLTSLEIIGFFVAASGVYLGTRQSAAVKT
ncbi:MAG: EamA family transporter [Nevskia sp.]|jgi:drug/metabolite transporter (DMT)-like permease|nr:EamA family transporter [Nevskia sp.]